MRYPGPAIMFGCTMHFYFCRISLPASIMMIINTLDFTIVTACGVFIQGHTSDFLIDKEFGQ
jgi:hypothetical protein